MIGPDNTVLMNSPSGGLENLKTVYFIGIGGIGMSALARYFKSKGAKVSGYDKTPSDLSRELEAEGMEIHYNEDVESIPKDVNLVVYTPAIPKQHAELVFYQEQGYPVVKRSDVLGWITKSSFNICVAGTHGKTTISTMIAHLLRDSGYGCNAFLGGISGNYGTNFWSSERNVCVIEADEYDRSFLKLNPDVAIISAMDADHLDIYGTAGEMEKAFVEFSRRIKPEGLLLSKAGLSKDQELSKSPHQVRHLRYSVLDDGADVTAMDIKMVNGSYEFDARIKEKKIEGFKLNMGGMHNVENAIAAIAVASSLQIENEKIKAGIASFKGVKRRFEYIIKTGKLVYIDDYAHHPEELKALISSALSLFSQWKCTVIFQPHLYSRTRDLADGFAGALDLADQVILLPVYPARELPIAGVDSEMILAKMKRRTGKVMTREALLKWISDGF